MYPMPIINYAVCAQLTESFYDSVQHAYISCKRQKVKIKYDCDKQCLTLKRLLCQPSFKLARVKELDNKASQFGCPRLFHSTCVKINWHVL